MEWEQTGPGEPPQLKVSKRAWVLVGIAALVGAIVIPTVLLWSNSPSADGGQLPAWIAGYQTEPDSLSLEVVLALCPGDSVDEYEKTAEYSDEVVLYIRLEGDEPSRCSDREPGVITFTLDEPLGDRRVTDGIDTEIPPYEEP